MIAAIFVRYFYHRLTNVMKKHGQAKNLVRSDVQKTFQNMFAYCITVMGSILISFHAHIKLRQKLCCHPCFICNAEVVRIGGNKKLYKLHLDSLGADQFKIGSQSADGFLCTRFYGKSQLGGKADSSQNPQRIVLKPLHGITHAADHLFFHVIHSAKKIYKSPLRMICHGINGKISPFQILFKI